MEEFWTSDTHFFHFNIIDFCKRPFESVEEMNAELVRRWNVLVAPEDRVYHLGDFAFGGWEKAAEIRRQLNGSMTWILGNHDRDRTKTSLARIVLPDDEMFPELDLTIRGRRVHMQHEDPDGPLAQDDDRMWLCGHVHDRWKFRDGVINVSVEQWAYAPVTWAELVELHSQLPRSAFVRCAD